MSAAPNLSQLSALPQPLWVARSASDDPELLPAHCREHGDRASWLLLLCEAGTLPLLRDGAELPLQSGEAVLVPYPDTSLNLRSDTSSWQILAFAYVGLHDLSRQLYELLPRFRLPPQGWARKQLSALADGREGELGLTQAMRLVAGILANIIEHNCQDAEEAPSTALLRTACERLQTAVESDLNVNQLAQDLGISRAHLTRLFHDHFRTSPGRYLHHLRMRRACALLQDIDNDIGDIGRRLGYGDHAAFYKAFRKATGMSPSDYRNSRSVPLWGKG